VVSGIGGAQDEVEGSTLIEELTVDGGYNSGEVGDEQKLEWSHY